MAIETIKGDLDDAKNYLMRQACKRYPIDMMLPCGHGRDLESGFVYEEKAGIMTFWYNVEGEDKSTKTEVVRLDRIERRKYDYDAHVPERRKNRQ